MMMAPPTIMRLMLVLFIAVLLIGIIFTGSAAAGEAAAESCSGFAGRISDITGGISIC